MMECRAIVPGRHRAQSIAGQRSVFAVGTLTPHCGRHGGIVEDRPRRRDSRHRVSAFARGCTPRLQTDHANRPAPASCSVSCCERSRAKAHNPRRCKATGCHTRPPRLAIPGGSTGWPCGRPASAIANAAGDGALMTDADAARLTPDRAEPNPDRRRSLPLWLCRRLPAPKRRRALRARWRRR